mgnify:CR=1 FL=1
MRIRFTIVSIILLISAGCGGGTSTVVDNPVQDSLDGMKDSLSEALASVEALTAPAPASALDGEIPEVAAKEMVSSLADALSALVTAAQDVVNASVGTPIETDAKAILSAAQELETKAKSGVAPATIEQGLQALLTRVNELRQKR